MAEEMNKVHSEETSNYMIRSLNNRFGTLSEATMKLIGYFKSMGGTEDEAKDKVDQLSLELFSGDSLIFGYIMGSQSCRSALFDKINASTLTFMDGPTKVKIIEYLTPLEE